jgi:glutathione S-transferase
VVWDSLAITEYLAERFPGAGIWPADAAERAHARAVASEMHSGFPALRKNMPFNVRRSSPGKGQGDGVAADIARICAIWEECRAGQAGGAFLFGDWSAADMFYAPVVMRFATYAVELGPACRAYADAVAEHPHVQEWAQASRDEEWVEPEFDL